MVLRFLSIIFLFTLFFPYTYLGIGSPGDLQPYNVIIGIVLVMTYVFARMINRTVIDKWVFVPLLILCINIFILILFSEISTNLVRGIGAYANFSILVAASYIALKLSGRYVFHVVIASAVIWNLVALIQFFFDNTFLTSLVNRTVITDDRGVISLSPEPSYYALICCVMAAILFVNEKAKVAVMLLIPVFILAKSAVVSLFLVASFGLYLIICGGRIVKLISMAFLLLVLFFINNPNNVAVFLSGLDLSHLGRIGTIIENIDKVFYFFIDDQSINTRLTHIYYSIYGFVENLGIPHGSSVWPSYISQSATGPILWSDGLDTTERINSGIGQVLFELGFASITIFYVIASGVRNLKSRNESKWLACCIFIFMLNTLSISYPPFSLLLATMLATRSEIDTNCSTQKL